MDEMTTRNHALVAWSGDSLEGMATWPSFPSAHGVLSVLAYLPLRGRAVLRGSRKTVRGRDRHQPSDAEGRLWETVLLL